MQYFYINEGSVLPVLKMELVNDGKYDFIKESKFNNAIQNADATFSMRDEDGVLKISNAECEIVFQDGNGGCDGHYVIEYKWNKRDTKKKGQYRGQFKIDFKGDLMEDGVSYPEGLLIMPIYEDLTIMVK